MSSITSTTLTSAIVKLIAAQFLPSLRAKLYMANLVNRNYEPILANAGDQISVPMAPTITVNNLAEGSNVQPQSPAPGNVQITLNTHIEATFGFTDIAKILSTPDVFSLYFSSAINACAEKVETDILGIYPEFTYNAPVGTAGSGAPTEADLDTAETTLFKAKLPSTEPKYLMLDADAYGAVRKISRFTENQTIGDGSAIATGVLGRIKDFQVLRSSVIPKTTVGGVTTTHNLAFARDAIAFVMRKMPAPMPGLGAIAEYIEVDGYGFRVLMSYDANGMITQVTVDGLYGVAAFRNQFALEVQS